MWPNRVYRGRELDIDIRDERNDDADKIHRITETAFQAVPYTEHTEQFIVRALRQANALAVSQVAEANGELIGHVAISAVQISDGAVNWFGIGPISVLPEYQSKGVGSRLMKSALVELMTKGAAGCVVLGDPVYYGRFGFNVIDGLVFPGVPPEYFQARSFGGDFPQGEVTYHEAFGVQS